MKPSLTLFIVPLVVLAGLTLAGDSFGEEKQSNEALKIKRVILDNATSADETAQSTAALARLLSALSTSGSQPSRFSTNQVTTTPPELDPYSLPGQPSLATLGTDSVGPVPPPPGGTAGSAASQLGSPASSAPTLIIVSPGSSGQSTAPARLSPQAANILAAIQSAAINGTTTVPSEQRTATLPAYANQPEVLSALNELNQTLTTPGRQTALAQAMASGDISVLSSSFYDAYRELEAELKKCRAELREFTAKDEGVAYLTGCGMMTESAVINFMEPNVISLRDAITDLCPRNCLRAKWYDDKWTKKDATSRTSKIEELLKAFRLAVVASHTGTQPIELNRILPGMEICLTYRDPKQQPEIVNENDVTVLGYDSQNVYIQTDAGDRPIERARIIRIIPAGSAHEWDEISEIAKKVRDPNTRSILLEWNDDDELATPNAEESNNEMHPFEVTFKQPAARWEMQYALHLGSTEGAASAHLEAWAFIYNRTAYDWGSANEDSTWPTEVVLKDSGLEAATLAVNYELGPVKLESQRAGLFPVQYRNAENAASETEGREAQAYAITRVPEVSSDSPDCPNCEPIAGIGWKIKHFNVDAERQLVLDANEHVSGSSPRHVVELKNQSDDYLVAGKVVVFESGGRLIGDDDLPSGLPHLPPKANQLLEYGQDREVTVTFNAKEEFPYQVMEFYGHQLKYLKGRTRTYTIVNRGSEQRELAFAVDLEEGWGFDDWEFDGVDVRKTKSSFVVKVAGGKTAKLKITRKFTAEQETISDLRMAKSNDLKKIKRGRPELLHKLAQIIEFREEIEEIEKKRELTTSDLQKLETAAEGVLSSESLLFVSTRMNELRVEQQHLQGQRDYLFGKLDYVLFSACRCTRLGLPSKPAADKARKLYHGVYPGGSSGSGDDISKSGVIQYEHHAGKDVAWVYFSHNWFDKDAREFPAAKATWISESGKIPYIQLMLRSKVEVDGENFLLAASNEDQYSLQKIIAGEFDDDIRAWAREAKDFGSPLLVEFGTRCNEPEFWWNSEYYRAGAIPRRDVGAMVFQEAYRHIIRVMRQEQADNITWVFHVGAANSLTPGNQPIDYYPGDEWIDWVAVSVHSADVAANPQGLVSDFATMMSQIHNEVMRFATGKPLIVAEIKASDAAWVENALESVLTRNSGAWPNLIGFAWWNQADFALQKEPSDLAQPFRDKLESHAAQIQTAPELEEPVVGHIEVPSHPHEYERILTPQSYEIR